MPIKGLEKGDGVPSSPCGLPQGYHINLYWEQSIILLLLQVVFIDFTMICKVHPTLLPNLY